MTRIASLFALVLLAGCASAAQDPVAGTTVPYPGPHAATQADATMITLNIGEQTTLGDGSRLTYQRLVNDSRCPPDVQCVWAGDAEIQLRWQPSHGGARDVSLHTSPMRGAQTETTLGAYRVKLETLARGVAPAATLSVTPATP